jgi:hypothetical protein
MEMMSVFAASTEFQGMSKWIVSTTTIYVMAARDPGWVMATPYSHHAMRLRSLVMILPIHPN